MWHLRRQHPPCRLLLRSALGRRLGIKHGQPCLVRCSSSERGRLDGDTRPVCGTVVRATVNRVHQKGLAKAYEHIVHEGRPVFSVLRRDQEER